MDLASILGLVLCIILVIFGIITGDQGVAAIWNFLEYKSALITFGGAVCAVLTSNSMAGFVGGLKSFTIIFKAPLMDAPGIIKQIIELSNVARKEGLLSLEEAASNLEDDFLKKGILLIVDGTDPELVRAIMETELSSVEQRHKDKIGFWENLASMGPAWGMIGTLIGLINMLQKMEDVAAVGPNMAVALITTLYGSMLANWICLPVAAKMKSNSGDEIMVKEIMIEGLLSIQAGENPRVIEEKLKSFLSPGDRSQISDNSGGDE
ncbi:motility protein A [bacterium C-53]|nr:motility protein A [Lachnospiraceae bacterium]NBI02119.1 motility protein A [Lachnospiraceae bacterium]RKJ10379.1 motility protein A [bacterium C-53]